MRNARFSVRISYIERPYSDDFERYIDWLCNSLGLYTHECDSARDIMLEIIKSKEGLSSTELSERLNKSRGAVINQLNKLIESGLIVKNGRIYRLRASTMERTLEELFEDVERTFARFMKIAEQIDRQLRKF